MIALYAFDGLDKKQPVPLPTLCPQRTGRSWIGEYLRSSVDRDRERHGPHYDSRLLVAERYWRSLTVAAPTFAILIRYSEFALVPHVGLGRGAGLLIHEFEQSGPHRAGFGAEFVQGCLRDAAVLAGQGQEQVLAVDLLALQLTGFFDRHGHHVAEVRGTGEATKDPRIFKAVFDELVNLSFHFGLVDTQLAEDGDAHARAFPEDGQEQVLGAAVVLVVLAGDILRELMIFPSVG